VTAVNDRPEALLDVSAAPVKLPMVPYDWTDETDQGFYVKDMIG
jgi:hypothetical protein